MNMQDSVQRAKDNYKKLLSDTAVLDDVEKGELDYELKNIIGEYVELEGHALRESILKSCT